MSETQKFDRPPRPHREIPETTVIAPVIKQLRSISFEQVQGVLDKKKEDARVGIGIINLSESGITEAVEAGNPPLRYQFYVAFVSPGGHVKSHYHEHGPEPYRFMFADTGGEMNLGHMAEGEIGEQVNWHKREEIMQDDEVEIAEKEVHSYYNTTEKPVFFIFACPAEHLIDYDKDKAPNGDRFIVENLESGIPEQHRH